MNDITKARHFFTTKGSKLKDLQSFGLMLATARSTYRDVRLRLKSGPPGDHEVADPIEVDALIDLGLLTYLSKTNKLPGDANVVLNAGTSLEDKRDIAMRWARS
jgi:hypothetical protein